MLLALFLTFLTHTRQSSSFIARIFSIALVLLLDALLGWAIAALQSPSAQRLSARIQAIGSMGLAAAIALLVVLYPLTIQGYPLTSLTRGHAPQLYEFFSQQPKDSLIAGLSPETSSIPSHAYRSVLVSPEVAIPYHAGYYREIQQRARDTIAAQYSPNPAEVKAFIEKYGVTHWLLDANAFDIHALNRDRWVQQYQPEAGTAVSHLASRQVPYLQQVGDRCTPFQTDYHRVIDTQCLLANTD